jgi:uncharacterized protein (TIGR02271 family)
MNDDVIFADGTRGTLVATPVPGDPNGMAEVLLSTGQTLFVPMSVLTPSGDRYQVAAHPAGFGEAVTQEGETVIPLVAETLSVGKREVETGRVRFSTTVTERVETVDEPLFKTVVEVKRVGVSQFVDAAPAVRYEQDVMIVPIMEEVLVVEKRLRVKEEVYISQKREEYRSPQQVTLRMEVLSEERLPAAGTLE